MKKNMLALLAIGMLFCLGGCSQAEQESYQVPALLEPVGVRKDTATAVYDDIYDITVYQGEVVPEVSELYFTADGLMGEVLVKYGDYVEKGQELMTLDAEALNAKIEELEDKIADIRTMGEFSDRTAVADIHIARYELTLLLDSGAAEERCEAKSLDVQMLQTQLGHAQQLRNLELEHYGAQLAELRQQQNDIVLKSPVAGTVVYITGAEEGDAIKGYTPVICIADEENKSISSEFIYEYLMQDAVKMCARIGERDYKVSYVPYDKSDYVAMALSNDNLSASFLLEEGEEQVQCGDYAAIMLYHSYKENVLTLPANALYRDASGYYVYKAVNDQSVRCAVEVGITTDTKAEILGGLVEGDEVYVKE